ncbi:MAG: hypothetical protein Hyperionvirus11_69 [Hyperionvirus sp.]|uniref:Uncharacterized protein n=1 Tax=Hyperionvirus sp. TaxID=2487770 RepID=A0A3G5A940_9VIRU|nr:MAG: hypothetical protein Hyperionvirus11_69 [Hyperionvirus sp.]
MKPTRLLTAFIFNGGGEYNVHPIYRKPCSDCHQPPPPSGLELSINSLSILNKTPEEIKSMTPTEIEKFRSVLAKAPVPLTKCPCKIPEDPNIVPKHKQHTDFRCGVELDIFCHCTTNLIRHSLKGESWSCPFCCAIVSDWACFLLHMKDNHLLAPPEFAVPPTSIGTHWCPLCRKTSLPGSTNLTSAQLFSKIMETLKTLKKTADINNIAVQNIICADCDKFDAEKKIFLPLFCSHRFH